MTLAPILSWTSWESSSSKLVGLAAEAIHSGNAKVWVGAAGAPEEWEGSKLDVLEEALESSAALHGR